MSDKMRSELQTQSERNITNILRTLATSIEEGSVGHYEVKHSSNGTIKIKVDSIDGKERKIHTKNEIEGYTSECIESIRKLPTQERRELVEKLSLEGHSQTEIAEKTMYSQKTISNDIKMLRNNGKSKN